MEKLVLAGIFALAASTSLAQTGGPANLCQELVAFVRQPPPADAGAAAPARAAAAPQGAAAAKPASGEAVPARPVEQTGSAQQASGQTGPAHGAPQPNAQGTEGTKADGAELKSSLSAPVPTDTESTASEAVLGLAEAEELARANDIAACQRAARELRLAGVAMPPPLLALTALDLQYHPTGEPPSQAPAAPAAPQAGSD
jgi:hypothetical protein